MFLIDIVTLFPRVFGNFISEGVLRIAQEKELVKINVVNFRDFSSDGRVDSRPFGGGAGMVLMAKPIILAVRYLKKNGRELSSVVLFTPSGKQYNDALAKELSKKKGLILLCGHYEGFDERISKLLDPLEISVGPYILSGGEVPAMIVLDSVCRLIPGVLGNDKSLQDESYTNELLEYPQYARPKRVYGLGVPKVLLSGNHKAISEWRKKEALKRTKIYRPDLYLKFKSQIKTPSIKASTKRKISAKHPKLNIKN